MFGSSKNKEVTYYKTGGKIGLKKGRKKITEPVYNKLKMPFDENGRTQACINDKWGVIDSTGLEIIPLVFDSIEDPLHGYIKAKNRNEYALYRDDGLKIIPAEYDDIKIFPLDNFAVSKGGKWGVITRKNELLQTVISVTFDEISYDGSIFFFVTKDGKTGIVDIDGKQLLAPAYDDVVEIAHVPEEEMKLFRFAKNGQYGIVSTFGDFISKPQYDFVDVFLKKIARIKRDDKWGFIGIRGEVLADTVYDELGQFNEQGQAHCVFNGRKGALLREALFRNNMPHQQQNK